MDSWKFDKIGIIVDNPGSWFWGYTDRLVEKISPFSREIVIYHHVKEIETGDILFILSCDRIFKREALSKFKTNIVIHASDLPRGRGWNPTSWQVEQGCNQIPITLFEAADGLDCGDWYVKDVIELDGSELLDGIRAKLYATLEWMAVKFLSEYPMAAHPQSGEETRFERRTEKNQELDIDQPLRSLFNKLRVCDNERYPAHFTLNGKQYLIKIYQKP